MTKLQDKYNELQEQSRGIKNEIYALKDKINVLEEQSDELKKYLKNFNASNKYTWYETECDRVNLKAKFVNLGSLYDFFYSFYITVKKRKDLKRYKYTVIIEHGGDIQYSISKMYINIFQKQYVLIPCNKDAKEEFAKYDEELKRNIFVLDDLCHKNKNFKNIEEVNTYISEITKVVNYFVRKSSLFDFWYNVDKSIDELDNIPVLEEF